MISNLVSLFIASRLQHMPVYEALAIQDGVHLPSAESRQRSGERQVFRVMRPVGESLSAETTVYAALTRLRDTKNHTWLVTDEAGKVVGVVNLTILEKAAPDALDKTVKDILDPLTFPHVHADHGVDVALERMGANQLDLLPVVNRGNIHQLEGVVSLSDVLNVYGIGKWGSA
jgi:CIC family chloride channel protein